MARPRAVPVNRPVRRWDLRGVAVVLVAAAVIAATAATSRGARGRGSLRHAAQLLRGSAVLLGLAVLSDSAMEHYRGSFHNPAMVLPLASSAALIAAELSAQPGSPSRVRAAAQIAAGGIGLTGLGFHLYDVASRPGGIDWLDLFYGAPIGAPAALTLAAVIGHTADRAGDAAGPPRLIGVPLGEAVAAISAVSLAGTSAEAALLHFRGAYQDPFMWLPVTLPPVGALLVAAAAASTPPPFPRLTRTWLGATALLGLVGSLFHARGIARNMGGWRNWRQNLLAGPPLPAPPSFSALALAGLAALDLLAHSRAAATAR